MDNIVDIDELDAVSSLRRRLAHLSPQTSPSIYRVPRQLGDVNMKAYEPEMVAIGPYHHGKDNLKMMEELKLRYVQSLVDHKPHVLVEQYIAAIAGMEKMARVCYAEPISQNASEFIVMLVVDGCFIIELISRNHDNERTYVPARSRNSLQHDLILLENQIPFFVLCKLYDLIQGPDKHATLMKRVLTFCGDVFPGNVLYRPGRRSVDVKHILDLVHSNWHAASSASSDDHTMQATAESDLIIPSASQLKDANIKFRKKEYDRNSSESLLRNLIAYEQYLPMNESTPVADYASLLDCLINSKIDVQILCRHGIIENMVGSEQVVADFVNRLTDKIIYYPKNFMYGETFRHINTYHHKRWNRTVAVFHRDYFSSPWAYVSFFGAVLLLLLTIAQTLFAALQQFRRR
ncbi:hypothetical protein ACS0TY_010030 [Phlomoides rotata]